MTSAAEPYIKIFGITFHIDRVAFTIPIGDGYNIYWYAIIIAAGLLLAMAYAFRRAPQFGIDKDRMLDVVLVSFIAALVGARAYYLIFDGKPITSVGDIFAVRNGGLAIYGGIIGAFLAGFIMCRIRKVKVLAMFDLAALGFLIGQGIGRWGNFINQEAYGTHTDSIFGMTGSIIGDDPVHPCFLYESFFCLLGFLLLHLVSKKRKFDGQIITLYMIWYGVVRFFIEGLRTDSLKIGILRISQIVSFVAVVAGVIFYFVLLARAKRLKAETGDYSGLFGDYDGGEDEAAETAEAEEPDGGVSDESAETAEENGVDNIDNNTESEDEENGDDN